MGLADQCVIDNDLYCTRSDDWWNEQGFGFLLRNINNPWRVPYFQRILTARFGDLRGIPLLDVGCGGGVLAEEFAAMGLAVTGIDPSEKSLARAREHLDGTSLSIDYRSGRGDALPFADDSFEIVSCCDVLEHIENWDAVIGEIARVLKPGGVFLYDTINRTGFSRFTMVTLAQDVPFTRFMPRNLHVWHMFIKPEELRAALARHGLEHKDVTGVEPGANGSPLRIIWRMYRFNRGKIPVDEFCKRMRQPEGPDLNGFYMGHAAKPDAATGR